MEYVYSILTDKIIAKINNFRESGNGTAGTKKAVDDLLLEEFGNSHEKGGLVDELVTVCKGLMEKADDGSASFDDPEPDSIYLRATKALAKANNRGLIQS